MASNNSTSTIASEAATLPPFWLSCLISVTYSSIFIAVVVLYAVIFRAMAKNPSAFSSAYYKYFVSLAIAEIIVDYFLATFGTICNLLGYCPGPPMLNYLLSALNTIAWPVEIVTDLVIAIDRLTAICFFKHYTIFAGKLPYAFIGAVWLIALVYASPIYTLTVPSYYDPTTVTVEFDFSVPFAETLANIYFIFEMCVISTAAALYLISIGFLCQRNVVASRKRKEARRRSSVSTGSSATQRAQRSLMIQSGVHFLMVIIDDILFYGYILQTSNVSIWVLFLDNVVYLSIGLVNATLAIVLNSTIRENVLKLFGKATAVNQMPMTSRRGSIRRGTLIGMPAVMNIEDA